MIIISFLSLHNLHLLFCFVHQFSLLYNWYSWRNFVLLFKEFHFLSGDFPFLIMSRTSRAQSRLFGRLKYPYICISILCILAFLFFPFVPMLKLLLLVTVISFSWLFLIYSSSPCTEASIQSSMQASRLLPLLIYIEFSQCHRSDVRPHV